MTFMEGWIFIEIHEFKLYWGLNFCLIMWPFYIILYIHFISGGWYLLMFSIQLC